MHKVMVLAGGCFWGMEELFRAQAGVVDTEVGYVGGSNNRPTYEHYPGHAEALRITFDDEATSQSALFDYFFQIHDPTTKDRQGNDIGSSYRSAIFYVDEAEKLEAERSIARNQRYWQSPIRTSLEPFDVFWSAEDYHQDYLKKHPDGYSCHFERPRDQMFFLVY